MNTAALLINWGTENIIQHKPGVKQEFVHFNASRQESKNVLIFTI